MTHIFHVPSLPWNQSFCGRINLKQGTKDEAGNDWQEKKEGRGKLQFFHGPMNGR